MRWRIQDENGYAYFQLLLEWLNLNSRVFQLTNQQNKHMIKPLTITLNAKSTQNNDISTPIAYSKMWCFRKNVLVNSYVINVIDDEGTTRIRFGSNPP